MIIEVKNNKIELPFVVEDGQYRLQLIKVNPKTIREWQEYLFGMIDEIRLHSGWSRYDIHNAFKEYSGIASTKELQTQEQWYNYIQELKFWVYNNFEIII